MASERNNNAIASPCDEEDTIASLLRDWTLPKVEKLETDPEASMTNLGVSTFAIDTLLARKNWNITEALRIASALGEIILCVEEDENGNIIEISLRKNGQYQTDTEEQPKPGSRLLSDSDQIRLAQQVVREILRQNPGPFETAKLASEITKKAPEISEDIAKCMAFAVQRRYGS